MGEYNVLVTGASGFIGSRLCEILQKRGFNVSKAVRTKQVKQVQNGSLQGEHIVVCEIDGNTKWGTATEGMDYVIHLASRAHIIRETSSNPLEEFRRVNVGGAIRLFEAAETSKVKRFVFVSSIGVNGNATSHAAFTSEDTPNPQYAYAMSKYEAEKALQEKSKTSEVELVIIRPPLVYGPGVKGNFLRLLAIVNSGMPLPLGSCSSLRSFVGLDNLVDLLIKCTIDPRAAGGIFLAGDGEDISTADLIRYIANALGKPHRLVAVPRPLLKYGARLIRKPVLYEQLCESLQVNIKDTCSKLEWRPPNSMKNELARMAQWYLTQYR